MAKKYCIDQDILDNPLYQKMISVCLDAIQDLGIWQTVKDVQLPQGKGLEIGGYVRLLCKRKQFHVFYRDIHTKEWSKKKKDKPGFQHPGLPMLHLNTKVKTNATLRGRNIIDTGMKWMLDHILGKFKAEQLALDSINENHVMSGCNRCRGAGYQNRWSENTSLLPCHEINEKIEYLEKLIRHIRKAVKNRTLRTMQKKQLEFNWLRYTSFVWNNINRDCLSALILKNFRTSVYLSDYLENQYKLKHMAEIGAISKTLIPYMHNIKTGSLKKAIDLIKSGEDIPQEMTLYKDTEKLVSWKDLKDQPFSVAHAMEKLSTEHHGDFLEAWMIQPKKVRRKAHWIIQCAVDGYISANWNLGNIPKRLWKPLISLMIQLALKEKNDRGYDIVVTQNWRREFFSNMSSISDNWREKPEGAIPARAMTLDELILHLPMGNFRAKYELEYLEKHTAAIAPPVEAKKRNVRL